MAEVSVAVPVFWAMELELRARFSGSERRAAVRVASEAVLSVAAPSNMVGVSIDRLRELAGPRCYAGFVNEVLAFLTEIGVLMSPPGGGMMVNPRVANPAGSAEGANRVARLGWWLWVDPTPDPAGVYPSAGRSAPATPRPPA